MRTNSAMSPRPGRYLELEMVCNANAVKREPIMIAVARSQPVVYAEMSACACCAELEPCSPNSTSPRFS
jgi:hypothetical protein